MSILAKLGLDSVGKLGDLLAPVLDKIPTAEGKAEALVEVRKVEAELMARQEEAAERIITAEAQSQSWLARSWRPIVSLQFGSFPMVFILIGLVKPASLPVIVDALAQVPERMWLLLTGVLVGYTALRSVFDKQNGQGLSSTLSTVWYGKKLKKLGREVD